MLEPLLASLMLSPLYPATVDRRNDDRPAVNASVTVIIPTCRRPQLVMRALDSALRQSYAGLNAILVIDGKDDRTRELASELKESRLRIVELRSSVGAAQARNIGVNLATTEWVAFLDDDDEWLPEKIARQMDAARSSVREYPVVSTRTIVRSRSFDWISPDRLYKDGEPMGEYLFCRRHFVDGARYMQTSTLLMRRNLMLKMPFRDLKRHQDWDWLLRAAAYPGVEFRVLPEPLAVFNVEEGRTSIGRSLDWRFSHSWATEMRPALTPRAYSSFVANECVSRAVKSRAGIAAYAELVRDFFVLGDPNAHAVLTLLGFLCSTEDLRRWLRRGLRGLRFRSRKSEVVRANV